jgi:hypothetical protein
MEREQQPQDPLDTYLLGDKSLRQWHHDMTHDEDGRDVGYQRSIPCSRYASTTSDAAYWALALACVYENANGAPDDPDEAMDFYLGLVVNDHEDVLTLVNENSYAVPTSILERINLEGLMVAEDRFEDDDEVEADLGFESPRDAALYLMCLGAWACESCGDPANVLGATWWMSNASVEIPEIEAAFEEGFDRVGLIDPEELVGNWLIDRTGNYVEVTSFSSEDEVRAAYDRIERLHNQLERDA